MQAQSLIAILIVCETVRLAGIVVFPLRYLRLCVAWRVIVSDSYPSIALVKRYEVLL